MTYVDTGRLNVTSHTVGQQKLRMVYQLNSINWQARTTGTYDANSGQLIFHKLTVIYNGAKAAGADNKKTARW